MNSASHPPELREVGRTRPGSKSQPHTHLVREPPGQTPRRNYQPGPQRTFYQSLKSGKYEFITEVAPRPASQVAPGPRGFRGTHYAGDTIHVVPQSRVGPGLLRPVRASAGRIRPPHRARRSAVELFRPALPRFVQCESSAFLGPELQPLRPTYHVWFD